MAEAVDEQEPLLLPGTVVGGRYKLEEPAGSGGMGSVWRAENVSLGNHVAIKFLHMSVTNLPNAPEIRARFEREARICAKLGDESLHIVRVMDAGVTEDGRPYLVMELLKGESLSERLEREGRLPLPLASSITTQLCRALHVAHVAGIVHRDLKPANVFLCRGFGSGNDVHVKLLDFGVAKTTLEMDQRVLTRAGFIMGTPAYMSPEQITAHPVDARADLWSVAAMVYRMVVGAPPFGNGSIGELGRRITLESPQPPSQIAEDLPRELDDFVKRGLAKKPDDRYQTTTDLAEALSDIAHGAPLVLSSRRVVHALSSEDLVTQQADVDAPTRLAAAPPVASSGAPPTVVDRPRTPSQAPRSAPRTPPPAPSLPSRHSPRRVSYEDAPEIESRPWKPPRSYTTPVALLLLLVAAGGGYYAIRYLGLGAWLGLSSAPSESSSVAGPESPSASASSSGSAAESGSAALSASTTAPSPPSPTTNVAPTPNVPSTSTTMPKPNMMPLATTTAATTTTTASAPPPPTATETPAPPPTPGKPTEDQIP